MRQNDGGDFGEEPLIRLLAKMQGGSMSEDEMKHHEELKKDAMNTAMMGTMGTVGNIAKGAKLAGQAMYEAPNLGANLVEEGAQAVKQISQNAINPVSHVSKGVKLVPSAYDLEREAFQRAAEKAPSFMEKFGPKAVEIPGESIPVDKFKALTDLLKKK